MTPSRARLALLFRLIAVAIAVTGGADPIVSMSRPPAKRVSVIVAAPAEHDAAIASVNVLKDALPSSTIFTVRDGVVPRLDCESNAPCVIVADGSRSLVLPADRRSPTALVQILPGESPNIALTQVSVATTQQDPRASGRMRVQMVGKSVAGVRTRVSVFDGAMPVGSATHEWTNDGTATLDVDWWPLADGARSLLVEAEPAPTERYRADNQIGIGLNVAPRTAPVLVYDARPSWASVFVRRALESDPRFDVRHAARLGPALSSGTTSARLSEAALEKPAVVIIGGPDALLADEVNLLDRYVRVRGGTLLLLPDRSVTGPASRWIGSAWREHLSPSPVAAGELLASEWLRPDTLAPFDQVVADQGGVPVIVATPSGEGRVIVSGALDSWRYRDGAQARFDDVWRGLVGRAAESSAALTLALPTTLAAATADIPIAVHRRTFAARSVAIRAEAACDGDVIPIRLWPSGQTGVFTGRLHAPQSGRCEIRATTSDGDVAGAALAVTNGPVSATRDTLAAFERLALSTSGLIVSNGEESKVARFLESQPSPVPASAGLHPMRAWPWLIVFSGCLCAEWWMRRREGLK